MKPGVGILIIILIFSVSLRLNGEEIEVLPSGLRSRLLSVSEGCQSLKLTGSISEEDQQYFKLIPESVSELDLSSLDIRGSRLSPYSFFKSKVRRLLLPENIKEIGAFCFAESALDSLFLDAGLVRLGEGAFYNCRDIKSIRIFSESLSEIERDTFYGCQFLNSVSMPISIRTIGDRAFMRTGVTSLVLPNVKHLGEFALAEMPMLTEVTLPSDVTPETGTFYGDLRLSEVPVDMCGIPALLFAGTGLSMNSKTIGSDTVGAGAFEGVTIVHLILNPAVRRIENNAFRKISGLQSVDVCALGDKVPDTASDAFSGVDIGKIILKTDLQSRSKWAEHPLWSRFNLISSEERTLEKETAVSLQCHASDGLIRVTCNRAMDEIRVFDISGNMLKFSRPLTNIFQTEINSGSEILLVDVRVGTERFIKKIFYGKE